MIIPGERPEFDAFAQRVKERLDAIPLDLSAKGIPYPVPLVCSSARAFLAPAGTHGYRELHIVVRIKPKVVEQGPSWQRIRIIPAPPFGATEIVVYSHQIVMRIGWPPGGIELSDVLADVVAGRFSSQYAEWALLAVPPERAPERER